MTKMPSFRPKLRSIRRKPGECHLYEIEYAPGVFTNFYAADRSEAIYEVVRMRLANYADFPNKSVET
jgi:hypothetical protein